MSAANGAANGGADYSAQWAEYYRSTGKHKEAEAIEAQMKQKVINIVRIVHFRLFRICRNFSCFNFITFTTNLQRFYVYLWSVWIFFEIVCHFSAQIMLILRPDLNDFPFYSVYVESQ